MLADVDSDFSHGRDGPGVQSMRLDTGGICFELICEEMSRPAFSHLATARISRTEKKDFRFSGGC
jgi:hypothetical protein